MRTRLTAQMTAWGAVCLLALTACAGDDSQEVEDGSSEDAVQDDSGTDDDQSVRDDSAAEDGADQDDRTAREGQDREHDQPGEEVPSGGSEQVPEDELPGEDVELYYEQGEELGVAGLDPEEAPLEVFDLPLDQDGDVVGELEPLDAVTVTGRQRQDPDDPEAGIWTEVELSDGYGWVDGGLTYFAGTEDVTEDYLHEVPPAEDAQTIAEGVAERAAGDGPDQQREPERTLISTPEDHGEDFYRLDVTGLQDDSVVGYRLFVTVEESGEEAGEGFELAEVEQTQLCRRGVTDDGSCA